LEGWKSGRIENGWRMEKWEDRKDFIFSSFLFGWELKSGGMEKMSFKYTFVKE